RQYAAYLTPEILAVVHLAQMSHLVRNNIIDDVVAEMNQPPIEHDTAVAVAGTPAGGGAGQAPALHGQPVGLHEMLQALPEPVVRHALQPGLNAVAHAM